MGQIQFKDVKRGNILLDKEGLEVEVLSISSFDEKEVLMWVRGIKDGITKMGTSPKDALVRKVRQ